MKRATPLSIAALNLAITDGGREIQLLPAGPRFRARDGRPKDVADGWQINREIAERLIAQLQAQVNPIVIDYEHQTLAAATNGQPAPAAGWFHPSKLVWREGEGLFATEVEWTAAAQRMVDAKEYRFISPVFPYDKNTGEVRGLLHAALTNNPALDGMADVSALAAACYAAQLSVENPMDQELLDRLRKALGLAADAEGPAVLAALNQLLGAHETFAALTNTVTADRDQRIAALTASQADPAKFVPMDVYAKANQAVADLSTKVEQFERKEILAEGLSSGRILPHAKAYAEGLSLAALKSFVAQAQPMPALANPQPTNQVPASPAADLSPEQVAICRMFGNDPEQVKKTMGAQ